MRLLRHGRVSIERPNFSAFSDTIVLKANQPLAAPATEILARTRVAYTAQLVLAKIACDSKSIVASESYTLAAQRWV